MAQVTRSVQIAPLPGPKLGTITGSPADSPATAASGGGNLGATMADMGSKILQDQQKIALDAKHQADLVAVTDAHNKLSLATQDLLYNPEKGAMTVTGKDALGLPDTVTDQYRQIAGDIHASLSNPEQQAKFSELASQDYVSTIGKVKDHAAVEYQKFGDQAYTANNALLKDAARINAGSPQDVEDVLTQVTDHTTAWGTAHGWPKDKIDEEIAKTNSDIHATVVEQRITNGDMTGARTYFDKNKNAIQDPKVQKNLMDQLAIGSTRMESQNAAVDILKKVGPDTTMTELLGEVDKMPNSTPALAEIRDATKERVTSGFNAIRQAQSDADKKRNADQKAKVDQAILDSANKIQNADITQFADPVRLVESVVTPADLAQMNPTERDGLYTYAKRRMDPGGVKNDETLYYKLMRSSTADPATVKDFINTDLTKYMGRLDESHFDALTKLQTELQKDSSGKSSPLLNDFRSAESIVNDSLVPITQSMAVKDAEALKASVHTQVANYQVQQQLKTGKPATDSDIQGFVDGLVIKGTTTVPGGIFRLGIPATVEQRAMNLAPGESMVVAGVTIDQPTIVGIAAELRRQGVPVTDTNISAAYSALVKQRSRSRPRSNQ